ncbi:transposase [Roseateles sp. DC23W]|uniref:Transposase n=1 Tax=Pelomonas dachongensis TaxID=3299029 RepID=A0ABW7EXB3_9BURK
MEAQLHERPLYHRIAGLQCAPRMPDEATILRFRSPLKKHKLAPPDACGINADLAQQGLLLKAGSVVDATIISAPSSFKSKDGERAPALQTRLHSATSTAPIQTATTPSATHWSAT